MFRTYDDWKLATPPEYDELGSSLHDEMGEPPIHEEEEDEPAPVTHRYIELDDRNDPPIL
jgi:hypothetical protein